MKKDIEKKCHRLWTRWSGSMQLALHNSCMTGLFLTGLPASFGRTQFPGFRKCSVVSSTCNRNIWHFFCLSHQSQTQLSTESKVTDKPSSSWAWEIIVVHKILFPSDSANGQNPRHEICLEDHTILCEKWGMQLFLHSWTLVRDSPGQ